MTREREDALDWWYSIPLGTGGMEYPASVLLGPVASYLCQFMLTCDIPMYYITPLITGPDSLPDERTISVKAQASGTIHAVMLDWEVRNSTRFVFVCACRAFVSVSV